MSYGYLLPTPPPRVYKIPQQRARRALAARRHCVGGAVATTMAGSWWGSLSVIYECCGLCISMAVTTEALDTAGVR